MHQYSFGEEGNAESSSHFNSRTELVSSYADKQMQSSKETKNLLPRVRNLINQKTSLISTRGTKRNTLKFTRVSVINPNGTSPSECRHFICRYTKKHYRIEGCLNTIDGHDMRCIYPPTSFPFYLSICWLLYTTISTETRVHTRLCSLTIRVLYVTILIVTNVQICTWVSLKETHVSYAGCLYQ